VVSEVCTLLLGLTGVVGGLLGEFGCLDGFLLGSGDILFLFLVGEWFNYFLSLLLLKGVGRQLVGLVLVLIDFGFRSILHVGGSVSG